MKIKDLLKKVIQANKLNEELGIKYKANLVLVEKYSKPIRIYKNSDLKQINDEIVDALADKILNNELVKIEEYEYEIQDTDFSICIELI